MTPASSGEDRLVPPMRYCAQYVPSGNTWVSPTIMPVFGSPGIEMSGTVRAGVFPKYFESFAGTWPFW